MITPSKDKATEAILGADAFVAITARYLDTGHAELAVFRGGNDRLTPTIASELLILVRTMLFGSEDEEE